MFGVPRDWEEWFFATVSGLILKEETESDLMRMPDGTLLYKYKVDTFMDTLDQHPE